MKKKATVIGIKKYDATVKALKAQVDRLMDDLKKERIRISQTLQDMKGFQGQLKRRNDQVAQLHSDLWDYEQVLHGREFKADGIAAKHEILAMRLRAYAREEKKKRTQQY